jgi:hypothetical protein
MQLLVPEPDLSLFSSLPHKATMLTLPLHPLLCCVLQLLVPEPGTALAWVMKDGTLLSVCDSFTDWFALTPKVGSAADSFDHAFWESANESLVLPRSSCHTTGARPHLP